MTRENILILLGVLVLISPWSGLPLSWLMWILPLIGLVVAGIGFTLRSRNRSENATPHTPDLPAPTNGEPPARSSHIAFS